MIWWRGSSSSLYSMDSLPNIPLVGFGRMWSWMRSYAAYVVIAMASISLLVFPDVVCFDCEDKNGQALQSPNATIFFWWLVLAPLIAGTLSIRRAWLIPIGLTLAHLATQQLAGNTWWDVGNNEFPIFFLDLLIGFLLLGLGTFSNFSVK
jgi:hypothetical protein